jgi:hypothetical protein
MGLRHLFFLIALLCIFGGVGVALYQVLNRGVEQSSPQETTPTPIQGEKPILPSEGTPVVVSQGMLDVTSRDGAKVRVYDIRQGALERGLLPDATNVNYYTLVDDALSSDGGKKGYVIAFVEDLEVFNILIQKTPYTEIQARAEQDLMQRLQISQRDFCQLRFAITVPKDDGSFAMLDNPSLCLSE